MPELSEQVYDVIARGGFPETCEQTIWEWADENVLLVGEMAAVGGYYDSRETPWVRRMCDLSLDPDVDEIFVMKSSRTGFTEAGLNIVRWKAKYRPGPTLFGINSDVEAKKIVETRLAPTLMGSKTESQWEEYRKSKVLAQQIKLPGMTIVVAGSGAKGPYMIVHYDLIILDELEEHSLSAATTTVDRARSRLATVEGGKLIGFSKPEEESGVIYHEYLSGSQETYHLPCPLCGGYQPLVWDQLQFGHAKDEKSGDYDMAQVVEDTWYRCGPCGGRIDERHKYSMNLKGRWVPASDTEREGGVRAVPRKVSMKVNDLYSNLPKLAWGRLAQDWIARFVQEPEVHRMKYFTTNHLGEPWRPKGETIERSQFAKLRAGERGVSATGEDIVLGADYHGYDWVYREHQQTGAKIPFPDLYAITIAIDKQKSVLKYVCCAWRENGECFPIDYGRLADESQMLRMLERPYPVVDYDDPAFISHGILDSRYEQMECYRACRDSGWLILPSQGVGQSRLLQQKVVHLKDEEFDGESFKLIQYNDHSIKCLLYITKISQRRSPRLWMPDTLPPEFVAECSGERYREVVDAAGFRSHVWDAGNRVVDWGDAMKLGYVLWKTFHGSREVIRY